MKRRCYSPSHDRYKNYGGRGISVCKEWLDNWDAFAEWAYSTGYDPEAPKGGCTLERKDVNGNYDPSNCTWVTMKEQCRNRRNTTRVGGKCFSQIAEELGISKELVNYRVNHGIPLDKPLQAPLELVEGKTLKEISKEYEISYSTIHHRFTKGARTIVELITPKQKRGGCI
jgi:hypothetical protein